MLRRAAVLKRICDRRRAQNAPYDMVTFMVFPLPVSTLIVFALISIFSSICVTSIKKIATHSSFENA